jgi:cyclopropane-fatty-acyl-phospholipid synthase
MSGSWSTDDLVTLVRIIVLNHRVLTDIEGGLAAFAQPMHWLMHALRRNTQAGSRMNISAHYDLGNDFYRLWLDQTMTYSCNIFARDNSTIHEASVLKYDHICRKLSLTSADHVIEIGSGWGGFAIHAAGTYGCRVTTTTISKAQYDLAKERIEQAGLRDRITLLMRDYREIEGRYSKLVSIEMIEAVGHEFLETFFACCGRLLVDDGVMALQSITINDQMYDQHIKTVDFIRRYIFPGGSIPSVTSLCNAATAASDLRLVHHEDITPHYQKTLIAWRQKFTSHLDEISTLGYNEQFIRMWEYYFCYCEAGFAERYIGDVQMLFSKPGWRGATIFTMSHE